MNGAVLLAAMIIAQWRLRDTAIGRIIENRCCKPLAHRLMAIERRHLLFAVIMIGAVVFASEWLAIMGPLDAGLVFLWDVATYVDIAMVAALSAGVARVAASWRSLRRRPRLRSRPRRAARSRRARVRRPAARDTANDDNRGWPIRHAA